MTKDQIQGLYRYCFSLTSNPEDAEDLLQTAIEKWILSRHDGDAPGAYVRKIIRNTFIDQCRRKQIVSFEPLEDDSPVLVDEANLEQLQIQRNLIGYIFKQLNNAEREVLYLWSMEGYSATDIAEETHQPRGTVLSRLYRIRKKVDALEEIQISSKATDQDQSHHEAQ